MSAGYEAEQKNLCQTVTSAETRLNELQKATVDLRLLLKTLQESTDITELNKTLVNKLIQRIEVHNNNKSNGHCNVKVDIYFTGAGMIDIPTEQEIRSIMDEIRNEKALSQTA